MPARSIRLERARRRIDLLKSEVNAYYWDFILTKDLIELRNLLTVADLTVQCFYQHFAGKGELLLALFEEIVRSTADDLGARVADEADAVTRLHVLVVDYYEICRPVPRGQRGTKPLTPTIAEFAQYLLTAQPADAARAFAPLVTLFDRALDDAVATGAVRDDVTVTGVLLQAIMFNAFATTISRSHPRAGDDAAEQLWDLVVNGIISK